MPVAAIVSTDQVGEMAHARELAVFAAEHGLPLVTVTELENRLRVARPVVERAATIDLPTDHGPFETRVPRCSHRPRTGHRAAPPTRCPHSNALRPRAEDRRRRAAGLGDSLGASSSE